MRYLQPIVCILLLITTPSTLLCSQISFPGISTKVKHSQGQIEDLCLMSYDQILNLLELIESGQLQKRCDFEDLERINQFLVFLAKAGGESNDIILQEDIAKLRAEENFYVYEIDEEYVVVPAVFYDQRKIVHCKNYWGAGWENTKAFIASHKKEIIIGAVIVVGVVTIVAVVGATTAVSAVASAGAVVADRLESEKEDSKKVAELQIEKSVSEIAANEPSVLKEVVFEKVESAKCLALEDQDLSFKEKAREMGAILTHEALDTVAELMSIVPQLQQEVIEFAEKILPAGSISEEMKHSVENYEKMVYAGHEKIDLAFATEQARFYSLENKTFRSDFYDIAALPPPGAFTEVTVDVKKLAQAGQILDRAELTKAGRSLVKKSYRDGSSYPKPVGAPEQINAHGQKMLDSILNHPEKITYERQHPKFGKIVEVIVPGKVGARFTADGEMIGFLEP